MQHTTDIYLQQNYLTVPLKRMAENIGRSSCYVIGRMQKLGLVVPAEIKEKFKKSGQIKPGNTPINKGKKQTEYMSAEAIERTKATRFKKGNLPHNTINKVGYISIRYEHKQRTNKQYLYVCISLGKWVPLHKHLWESKNGPVPPNHCLWFKDGNSLNCWLENIECITRSENIMRNNQIREGFSDKRIASFLATKSKKLDRNLRNEILANHKELIILHRNQLKLTRTLKTLTHGT